MANNFLMGDNFKTNHTWIFHFKYNYIHISTNNNDLINSLLHTCIFLRSYIDLECVCACK